MATPGLLVLFTEGDRVRGFGHVSRCSAYARAWLDRGGQVCWILDGDDEATAAVGAGQRVIRRCWQDDGVSTLDVRPALALVDSYTASDRALRTLAAAADVTVFIDDLGRVYPPAVVVHPAPDEIGSAVQQGTDVLHGPSWQPLRPPFWDLPAGAGVRSEVERVLVVFGGGDLRGMGLAMARLALEVLPSASVDLVLGAGQPKPDPMPGMSVHQAIDAAAMASLMRKADIAISGAGQTVFELARCGTPAILVGIAENQLANLDHWPGLCGYIDAGWWDASDLHSRVTTALKHLADPGRRQDVSLKAAGIVDGQGVRRLFDHLDQRAVQEGS